MTHSFNPTILREYDVRGIVGDTLTEADAYALGRGYAALATEEGAQRIAVGRDGRTHSPELEAELIRGLTEGGLDVVRIGRGRARCSISRPTTCGVDGGIQVTGSHNPADYNGFKLLLKGRSVFGEEIQALGRRCAAGEWSEGEGTVEDADVARRLCRPAGRGLPGRRISGSAGTPATAPAGRCSRSSSSACPASITRSSPTSTAPSPTTTPTRRSRPTSQHLKQLVADKGLDFGIAFDGDADRIGAVDGQGRVIWGDQLLMILSQPVLKEMPARPSSPTSRRARSCSTASPNWAARR